MPIPSIHLMVNSTKVEKLREMMHSLWGKKGQSMVENIGKRCHKAWSRALVMGQGQQRKAGQS